MTITVAKSSAKEITAVKLLDADKSLIAEGKLSGTTWTITLPSNTDKALINRIGSATDVYMQVLHTGVSVRQEDGWNDAGGAPYWNSGDVMCGISVNTSKKFTVTAENGDEQTYTVAIKYTAPNAPTLSDGSAARSSKTAATVKFTTNEAGTYYYKVVNHGAAAPTVEEIMKSTTKGSASAGETTFTLSNLTEDARDVYIVVVSASGGESAPLKVEIPAYDSSTETPDEGKFTITISAPPNGGTIKPSRTRANQGDVITVTVIPNSGYQMVEGSLSYSLGVAGGETVKITDYKFTMPASNVSIACQWETASVAAKGITAFSINGIAGAVNNTTNTITITLPHGTDVTKLTPAIATNGVKSLTPGSGETVNFTNSVTYKATMEDGSVKTYIVTVYVDKGTLADQFWDKLTDFVNQVPWWEYAKNQQSTSSYRLSSEPQNRFRVFLGHHGPDYPVDYVSDEYLERYICRSITGKYVAAIRKQNGSAAVGSGHGNNAVLCQKELSKLQTSLDHLAPTDNKSIVSNAFVQVWLLENNERRLPDGIKDKIVRRRQKTRLYQDLTFLLEQFERDVTERNINERYQRIIADINRTDAMSRHDQDAYRKVFDQLNAELKLTVCLSGHTHEWSIDKKNSHYVASRFYEEKMEDIPGSDQLRRISSLHYGVCELSRDKNDQEIVNYQEYNKDVR